MARSYPVVDGIGVCFGDILCHSLAVSMCWVFMSFVTWGVVTTVIFLHVMSVNPDQGSRVVEVTERLS
jgi:hypothetical protein